MKNAVLIVDDDTNLLDSLRRSLRKEPYTILTTSSCEEALRIFDKTPINVVITDQDMPEMSGVAFLKRVCERHPETIRFMLTGKATLDNAIDAINDGGISRFLLKPCNPIELVMAIRQGIQQQSLMAAAYKLLQKNKLQTELLSQLESQYPSITKVERDADGAIAIEDFPGNINQLLEEIGKQLKED
jgi:two-component system, probable response regulator PhcQ